MKSKNEIIDVSCFRFDPGIDEEPYYKSYKVPFEENMSILDVLDYIYENLDSSLSYIGYCSHGICGECKIKVNNKVGLACKIVAQKEVRIDPFSNDKVVKDLIAIAD